MPGLVGLITKLPREQAECELRQMVAALGHETFYESGTWIDESIGVYLGWVVRKPSFADCMPVIDERGDVVLAFAGQEYRTGREAPGYLARLYREDADFPASLNGLFHGVVADRRHGTATLFADRYGMHRVYYHESRDAFYLAAEAKAILAVRPELRSVDPRGLAEFVSCGCVLENRTVFDRIHVLPGGAAWRFCNASLSQKRTYFQPHEWEQQTPLAPEAYYQELREVFSRNLPQYFNGRERIGVALTGGLDSRLIMACRTAVPQSLACYTFGSMFRDNQDVRVARAVSRLCEQPHETIRTGPEFLSRFQHYAERTVFLTDGCLDVSRAPDLYVSEQAREIAPVKIVGTYGSEVLSTTPAFKPARLHGGLFAPELLNGVRQAETTYAQLRRGHPVTFAAFRQSPWWHQGILALEQTQLQVRSPYLDNDFIRTVYRAPVSAGASRDVRLRMIGDGNPVLARLSTDRGVGGERGPVSSAVSRALLSFTLRAEYAYDYGMPQWLARLDHGLSSLRLERLFLGRHKSFHFRVWYRDALAPYVREVLLDRRTLSRPFLQRDGVEAVVARHLSGAGNYTREIHKLLTLELLHRQFVDA